METDDDQSHVGHIIDTTDGNEHRNTSTTTNNTTLTTAVVSSGHFQQQLDALMLRTQSEHVTFDENQVRMLLQCFQKTPKDSPTVEATLQFPPNLTDQYRRLAHNIVQRIGGLISENKRRRGERTVVVMRSAAHSTKAKRGVSELVAGVLFLGSVKDANDIEELSRNNIQRLLAVAEEATISAGAANSRTVLRLSLRDVPEQQLEQAIEDVVAFVEKGRARGERTLLFCMLGVSRSAALAIGYLMKTQRMTLHKAHEWVRSRRPMVAPNAGFLLQLAALERKWEETTNIENKTETS
jgi:protein-tyrosine phosphatase